MTAAAPHYPTPAELQGMRDGIHYYRRSIRPSWEQSVEASELGLRPGSWPKWLHRGAQLWMRFMPQHDRDGDLQAMVYVAGRNGELRLVVWND